MAKRPEKVHYIPPQRRKAGPLGPASAASPALPAARHISPTAPAAAQPAHHRSPRFDPVSVVPASPAPAPAPAPASTQRTPRSDSLVPSSPHPPHDAMVGQSATFKVRPASAVRTLLTTQVARGDMSFYTGGKQALKESSFMKLASQGKYGKPPSYVNSHVETLEVIVSALVWSTVLPQLTFSGNPKSKASSPHHEGHRGARPPGLLPVAVGSVC